MFLVEDTINQLLQEVDKIPLERKENLKEIAAYIDRHGSADLIFICTHNSRRSHIAQIWTQAAAAYFNVSKVKAFSGGTESTAFNPAAVRALCDVGFKIAVSKSGTNPHYAVQYSTRHPAFDVFSKRYDDATNPRKDFAAIITCTDADRNCPIVAGASVRISLPYHDPKHFDGTWLESMKYRECVLEIGREILFSFSQIERR